MTSVRDAFESMAWGTAPESPTLANEWFDRHGRRFGQFIDGAWTAPGDTFTVINPATGREIAQVTQGSNTDVDAAVAAARAALPAWQALGGAGRARWLYAIARGMQRNARLFSVVESIDNGKPIRESRDIDIPLVARHFYHHAGWAQLLDREFPGMEAVGVVGQVIPWNFPLLMMAWKIAPAIAAGNTVVLKPAEFTPMTALCFAELLEEIGLPAGVVNIITGDGKTGAALVGHAGVDKVAFTGSTDVGRAIRAATAGSGKKLTLELGGKSPFIVFDDADMDSVVEGCGRRDLVQPGAGLLRWFAHSCVRGNGGDANEQVAGTNGDIAHRFAARQVSRYRCDRGTGAAGTHRGAGEAGRR